MTQWCTARLEEVAEVFGGGTPSRTEGSYFGGGVAWATPTDVTSLDGFYISATKETVTEAGLKNSSTKLLPAGAVLLTSRATIGFTAVSTIPICTNQGFVNFVCGADLQPEFLAYWLRTQRGKMLQHAGGTTFKEIARGTLRKFEITFPSLAEQRRIVDLLSRAEGIVRLCREAQRKAAELIPAIFLDIVGDPATNPKSWPLIGFGELVENKDGRRKPVKSADRDNRHGPYPYYGASGVIDYMDEYIFDETNLLVAEDGANLVSRSTPIAFIAKGRYWVNNHAHVVGETQRADLSFLSWQLNLRDIRDFITGSAQPKLNQANLNVIPIIVPPLDLQHQFAAKAAAVRGIVARQTAALATAQAAFDALLHRTFAD